LQAIQQKEASNEKDMLTLEQTQKKAMEEIKSKEEQKELEIAQAEHEDELQEQ
jgi:hypothetical protein